MDLFADRSRIFDLEAVYSVYVMRSSLFILIQQ